MATIRTSYSKIRALSWIFEKRGQGFPLSLVTRLPCLAEDKVSNVNLDVQRLHENIK